MLNDEKRPAKRKAFAAIAVIAGAALVVLELLRPGATSAGERWFWLIVGLALVGLGVMGLLDRGDASD